MRIGFLSTKKNCKIPATIMMMMMIKWWWWWYGFFGKSFQNSTYNSFQWNPIKCSFFLFSCRLFCSNVKNFFFFFFFFFENMKISILKRSSKTENVVWWWWFLWNKYWQTRKSFKRIIDDKLINHANKPNKYFIIHSFQT